MSIQSIQVYRSKVEKIIQYGGTHNDSALPDATWDYRMCTYTAVECCWGGCVR